MHKKNVLGLTALALAFSPLAYADTYTNQTYSSEDAMASDTAVTAQDAELNKTIRDKVTRGWLWDSYRGVSLSTNNGTVTLKGTVEKDSDKEKLITAVQDVPGVVSVRSDLVVAKNGDDTGRRDVLAGKWQELKGRVKEKWGKLTDDDLMEIDGKKDILIGKLRAKYGYSQEKAAQEVNNFETLSNP